MLKIKDKLPLIGIAMALTGNVYGMYFNYLLPGIQWSPVFMLFSILFVTNVHNLFKFKFPQWNYLLTVVLIFQVIMLLYGCFSEGRLSQNLFFHLYVITLCISVATMSNSLDFSKLPFTIFLFSIPLLVLGAVMTRLGLVSGELHYTLRHTESDFTIEPFTVANGALINFFAMLCLNKDKVQKKIFLYLSAVIAFYIVISCTKRTPVFVMFVGALCYVWSTNKNVFKLSYIRNLIGIIIILLICYLTIDFVNEKVDGWINKSYYGIQALLGDVRVDPTGSAAVRVQSRNWALNYIDNNFTFTNYLIGGGYFIRWLDLPILEAYLDMGLIGLFFYGYIIVLYPVNIIRKRTNDMAVLFLSMISLYAILSIFNSGHPYQWNKYVRVCILSVVWYYNKQIIYDK